jgi:hypothetical protein
MVQGSATMTALDGTVHATAHASFVELDPELVTALAARNAERILSTPTKGSQTPVASAVGRIVPTGNCRRYAEPTTRLAQLATLRSRAIRSGSPPAVASDVVAVALEAKTRSFLGRLRSLSLRRHPCDPIQTRVRAACQWSNQASRTRAQLWRSWSITACNCLCPACRAKLCHAVHSDLSTHHRE